MIFDEDFGKEIRNFAGTKTYLIQIPLLIEVHCDNATLHLSAKG